MKICWDNLENLKYLSDRQVWRSKNFKYYKLEESCTFCNEPYLQRVDKRMGAFGYCSRTCQMSCGKQRKRQGTSLKIAWSDSEKKKKMIKNTQKAVKASQAKRHEEIKLIDKNKKTCSACGKEKEVKHFNNDNRLILKISSTCKSCSSKQYKNWTERDGNKEKRKKYARDRVNSNPKHKLNMRISNSIRCSIVSGKNGKTWSSLVDYSIDDLMQHLEKQFTDGMTWENYGEWHIDHKIPISVFNFEIPEHENFKRCWSLKNLQPMWASENISKGAKLEKHFQPRLAI